MLSSSPTCTLPPPHPATSRTAWRTNPANPRGSGKGSDTRRPGRSGGPALRTGRAARGRARRRRPAGRTVRSGGARARRTRRPGQPAGPADPRLLVERPRHSYAVFTELRRRYVYLHVRNATVYALLER